jgi:hypothetical protein
MAACLKELSNQKKLKGSENSVFEQEQALQKASLF